ncbi:MAG: PorT family protein [Calditrichaeota bacterium]|nr:PorT family protein [Calditrichota bacterium]
MKGKLFLPVFLFLLFFIHHGNSQILKGYGLKIGLTIANQDFDYTNHLLRLDSKYRAGINAGFFMNLLEMNFIELAPEINYTQKGMKHEVPFTTPQDPGGEAGESRTNYVRLDYLNFRISGKFKYPLPAVTPFFLLGPRVEYKINDKMDAGYRIIYDKYDDILYGLSAGFGIAISSLVSTPLIAEFIYNYDFNTPYQTDNLAVRNIDFEMRLGIQF